MRARDFTRIFLWRHPEVRGVSDGKVYGHYDVALTRHGQDQAQRMVKVMSAQKLSAVYTSDLQRTSLVGEAISRAQRSRQVFSSLPALRELNLGDWEGMPLKTIEEKYPDELAQRWANLDSFRIPGGESLEDLAQRVVPAFQQIVADHQGQQVCIVSHAGVNRVLLCALLGAPLERIFRVGQDYACLNLIDVYADGIPVVQGINLPTDAPLDSTR